MLNNQATKEALDDQDLQLAEHDFDDEVSGMMVDDNDGGDDDDGRMALNNNNSHCNHNNSTHCHSIKWNKSRQGASMSIMTSATPSPSVLRQE